MTEQINKVITSYKDSFKSPVAAYAYLLLNQKYPELFVISTNEKKISPVEKDLCSILEQAQSLDEIIDKVQQIPSKNFDKIISDENEINQRKILKDLKAIKYSQVDWTKDNSWENLSGAIEYNKYSNYLNTENKALLLSKMNNCVNEFNLSEFNLNPNYQPKEFINNIKQGIYTMCEGLGITPRQIGLGVLQLNYQTEEGDFTGYVHYGYNAEDVPSFSKMVLKKSSVFAHEWMHFVESSLGIKRYSLTDLMEKLGNDFPKYMKELNEVGKFQKTIHDKINEKTKLNFSDSIVSLSHFLQRYALNGDTFKENIKQCAKNFKKSPDLLKNPQQAITSLKKQIEELLADNYPTRYFSFLEAQCQCYIEAKNNKIISKFAILGKKKVNKNSTNQLIDFAQKADLALQQNNYTESTIEIFARTFEAYLHDKLAKENKTSSVLADSYENDMYQQGTLKENVNNLWDKMWLQIKKEVNRICPPEGMEIKPPDLIVTNIEELRKKFINKSSPTLKM